MSKIVLTEERAMIADNTPIEDYAVYFYKSRYWKLRGVPVENTDELIKHVVKMIDESADRFPKETTQRIQKWSMNWYRTRNSLGKWKLSLKDKERLYASISKLGEKYSNLAFQCIPISGENNDMCLIAVEIAVDTSNIHTD